MQVADEPMLSTLVPDQGAIAQLSRAVGLTGVTVFAFPTAPGGSLAVRSFAPAAGIAEDPVCGSGNAAVGAYLSATDLLRRSESSYRASQGREVGRDGTVEVSVSESGRVIEIGGTCVTVIAGHLAALPE